MRVTIILYASIFPLLLFNACSMDSSEESRLNSQLQNYINARNGCSITGIIGLTHPEYIKELKSQGDSVLISTLRCSQDSTVLLTDPIMSKSVQEGDKIHIKYSMKSKLDKKNKDSHVATTSVFAISEDAGTSFLFLPEEIYINHDICPSLTRLIK